MPERDRQELIGMAVAAVIAAIGAAAFLFTDLRPAANSDSDLVTASVLSRAGATSTPSARPDHLVIPTTVPAIR
jgi:Tfp pilus assembly protein FimT